MYILFSLGRALERLWGSFYFDLYILIGIISLIVAALLVYMIGGKILLLYPDNLYLSLILAFGMTVPDMQFLLYFIIPIKAKYIMIFYGAILAYQFVTGGWPARVQIIASLFNFFLFFLLIRRPFKLIVLNRVELVCQWFLRAPPDGAIGNKKTSIVIWISWIICSIICVSPTCNLVPLKFSIFI